MSLYSERRLDFWRTPTPSMHPSYSSTQSAATTISLSNNSMTGPTISIRSSRPKDRANSNDCVTQGLQQAAHLTNVNQSDGQQTSLPMQQTNGLLLGMGLRETVALPNVDAPPTAGNNLVLALNEHQPNVLATVQIDHRSNLLVMVQIDRQPNVPATVQTDHQPNILATVQIDHPCNRLHHQRNDDNLVLALNDRQPNVLATVRTNRPCDRLHHQQNNDLSPNLGTIV